MRTWAEINLDALVSNYKEIRRITHKNTKILATVKADAYGHGFLEVAKALSKEGVDAFSVALIEEGLQLRQHGFREPILVLGSIPEEEYEKAIENDISLTVFSKDTAELISKAAKSLKKTAKVHIKLDTGMSRLGYVIGEENSKVISEIMEISKMENIEIEGVFSHFSTSDEEDTEYTDLQFNRFISVCDELNRLGLKNTIRHIANSAAIIMHPETHLDMVRPGIILYGLYPSEHVDKSKIKLTPVMSLKTQITHIKTLEAGRGISYGKDYITNGPVMVATVPVGYGDGYVRAAAKEGWMFVRGQKAKILGRICMDQCMIDVSNVNNISIGDETIVFSDKEILADDVAKWTNTINYEVVCLVSKRIPRIYKKNGEAVKELNFLEN